MKDLAPRITMPLAAALLVAIAAPAGAADRVSGSCTKDDTTYTFTDGVAFKAPDPFDDTVAQTVVMLTTLPLDKVAIARASDKDDAVGEQMRGKDGGASVEIDLDAGLNVTGLHLQMPTGSSSTSGTLGQLEGGASDATHVAGRFANQGGFTSCDVSFDLAWGTAAAAAAAAPPAPTGKPLAAGGGEPGKAFMRNLAAMQKGDIDGMIATASKEQADEMRKSKDDPDFAQMLDLMKAFAPKTAKVVGGRDFGDRAELDVDGTDADGGATKGLVKMVKEADGWKVEKSSFKSGG